MKKTKNNSFLESKGNLHDLFFREVYSKKKYVLDLFRIVLKKEEYAYFDWKRLKAELASFVNEEHREKRADLIFSVPIKNSKRIVKIIFLLEHKSYQDKKLLLQLLHYQNYLYTRFPHNPVIPIVIYHGREKHWKLPKDFQSYSLKEYPPRISKLLRKNMLNFPYKLLNIHDLDTQKKAFLTTGPILFILKSIWSLNKKVLGEFFLRSRRLKKQDKYFLLEAATYYIHKNDRRFTRKALEEIEKETIEEGERSMSLIKMAREEAVQEGREESIKKGIAEGIEKGREEGIEKVALRMLEKGMDIKNICIYKFRGRKGSKIKRKFS